jgi:hypothetical protein
MVLVERNDSRRGMAFGEAPKCSRVGVAPRIEALSIVASDE